MTSRGNWKVGRLAAAVALAAVVGVGDSALAQTRARLPSPDNDRPLMGVPSKAPRIRRPTTGGGLPINRTNTLLPQSQQRFKHASPNRRIAVIDKRVEQLAPGAVRGRDGVVVAPGANVPGGFAVPGRHGFAAPDGAVLHVGTDGFRARGIFRDDDSSIAFHVGSGGLKTVQPHFGIPKKHHHRCSNVCCKNIGFTNPFFYDWWDDDYYAPTLYYAGYASPFVTTGQTYSQQVAAQQAAAAAAQQAQPPQLTPLEQAALALAAGEAEEAVRMYREYLDTHTESPEVVRSLALALFEAGRIQEAAATMALAYEREPSLASRPVEASILEGDRTEMLARVRRAVTYAHKVNTASAWLTVTVLMQAQERDRVALKMAERAKEAGLAEPVYNEFKVAMGG